MPSGDRILPFLKWFYSSPSTYVWEDDMGTQHEVTQGEGGEQGDPFGAHVVLLGAACRVGSRPESTQSWRKVVRILGRHPLELPTGQGPRCAPDSGGGTQDEGGDPSPSWQDSSLEQVRLHTQWSGRDDRPSKEDCQRRHRVEFRPEPPKQTARHPSAHRSRRVCHGPCGQEDRRTPNLDRTDSVGARSACDFFKTSDDNEAILDVRALSKGHLRNYNVQALVTKWDEIRSALTDPTSRQHFRMPLQNAG